MVATVADLGYGATRVADVSELSGVSSRSFYDRFPKGKEECFLALLEELLSRTETALAAAGESEEDWVERLRVIYRRFAEIVAAQPAAASLVLIEAYAAGRDAVKQLDKATTAFERLSRRRLEESPERVGLPATMIQAQVGALQELARARLGRGEAATLPLLVPELVELVAGYRPPPQRLRLGTRRPAAEPEPVASSDEAERVIRGFTKAVAEQGFAGATIQEIARQSGISPNTFYAHFRDQREALLATVDSSTAQMTALAMAAYRRSPGWSTGVRAMFGSALNFLASRPATANVLLVEIYSGGPEALAIRSRGMREITNVLDEGPKDADVPAITPEVIAGGLLALARRQLLSKGPGALPALAPVTTYMALAPYVGAEEACEVANGASRPTPSQFSQYPLTRLRRSKWAINAMLAARWATVDQIAQELNLKPNQVAADLREMEEEGLVEQIASTDDEKPPEWTNTKWLRLIDGEDWSALSLGERRRLIRGAHEMAIDELTASLESDLLGRRLDETSIRMVMELDDEGWNEIADIHRGAFNAIQATKEKSERRLRESGSEPSLASSIQFLFELPPRDA